MLSKIKQWLKETSPFDEYDARGVRAFIGYRTNVGTYGIEIYRKKTEKESEGEHDWKMIRISHIASYHTRKEAEEKALNMCENICEEFNF